LSLLGHDERVTPEPFDSVTAQNARGNQADVQSLPR
uniref:Manganese peroxidase (Fragments) n=1 Tax=Irpex lacteus TaxID=5319 RepID=PEM_IRPLA|nr:RecName: Full=Manganese peroxidase; AltName: Full=Peroxidase manganese-dependent [Irpex lacteus]